MSGWVSDTHAQRFVGNGITIISTSITQVLGNVENEIARLWNIAQWHNIHIKFRENLFNYSLDIKCVIRISPVKLYSRWIRLG
jgi:hypothetical protein